MSWSIVESTRCVSGCGYICLDVQTWFGPQKRFERCVIENFWNEAPGKETRYKPLRLDISLFRVFANTPPTEEGILAFANKYGFLGGPLRRQVGIHVQDPKGEVPVMYAYGDRLSDWQQQINLMSDLVTVWDKAMEGDTDWLSRRMRWRGLRYVFEKNPPPPLPAKPLHRSRADMLTTYGLDKNLPLELCQPPEDLQEAAKRHVASRVSYNLQGMVSPVLEAADGTTDFRLELDPYGLIGALWLQFAQSIARNEVLRVCPGCKTPITLSPDVARSDREFCSHACRQADYRKRQAAARQLHSRGLGLSEIAEQVGSDPKTVHSWLTKSRRRKGKGGEGRLIELERVRRNLRDVELETLSRLHEIDRELQSQREEMEVQVEKRRP